MEQALKYVTDFLRNCHFPRTLKSLLEEQNEKRPERVSFKQVIQFNRWLNRTVGDVILPPKTAQRPDTKGNESASD
jgi:hypothetical protein